MVGGQYVDVAGRGTPTCGASLHQLKTGRLIAASVECVLLLRRREERTVAYSRFAAELGVLFQIVDDILDVTGSDDDSASRAATTSVSASARTSPSTGSTRARALAARSHATAREALAEAAAAGAARELAQITDFIFTRTS